MRRRILAAFAAALFTLTFTVAVAAPADAGSQSDRRWWEWE